MNMYDKRFYDDQVKGSTSSAREIVPIITRILNPLSVIDIGCGTGAWLSVFRENGVKDIMGVDGHYVGSEVLLINKEHFKPHNLEEPLNVQKQYDLAISLEVAEHIDPKKADSFVQTLTELSPVVLFSAAIPHQWGKHHVNEQWPGYWKAKFFEKGICHDRLYSS